MTLATACSSNEAPATAAGGPDLPPAGTSAAAATSAAADHAPPDVAPASSLTFVDPLRGEARIGYTPPAVKRDQNMVVTVFEVKNLSEKPVVGLRLDEFWYDRAGNPLPSDSQRLRKALQPGEVAEIELRTPYSRQMDRNSYRFRHANGTVKMVELKSLDDKAASPRDRPRGR
jgi:hypothetical protein